MNLVATSDVTTDASNVVPNTLSSNNMDILASAAAALSSDAFVGTGFDGPLDATKLSPSPNEVNTFSSYNDNAQHCTHIKSISGKGPANFSIPTTNKQHIDGGRHVGRIRRYDGQQKKYGAWEKLFLNPHGFMSIGKVEA